MAKKRRCSVCRKSFIPDPRVGDRQKTCGPECQKERRRRNQMRWRRRYPDYFRQRYLKERTKKAIEAEEAQHRAEAAVRAGRSPDPHEDRPRRPAPIRMEGQLRSIPWDSMQDDLGVQATDYIAVVALVLLRAMQAREGSRAVEGGGEVRQLQDVAVQSERRSQDVENKGKMAKNLATTVQSERCSQSIENKEERGESLASAVQSQIRPVTG